MVTIKWILHYTHTHNVYGYCVHAQSFWLFVTSWIAACQVPLSMWFSSQGYWSGLSFPSPRNLLYSGIKLHLLRQQADSLPLVPLGKAPGKSLACDILSLCWGPSLDGDRLVWGSESSHTAPETVVLNLSWGRQSFYELMKTLSFWRMAPHESKLLVLKIKRF